MNFFGRSNTTVMSTQGMVSAPSYLASQVALTVLKQGGNAVESAIAGAAAMSVVYPHMNTIGGDNFWLIYNANTTEIKGLESTGAAGKNVKSDFYHAQGYKKIPARGYLAVNTVPGAVAGWQAAYNYSQQQMNGGCKWQDLLQPAIEYAAKGFPVSANQHQWLQENLNSTDQEFGNLRRFEGFNSIFFKSNGKPYQSGEILRQTDLAETMSRIAKQGGNEFYLGETAKRIVKDLQSHNGLLTLEDFARHKARWVEPISVDYRGYKAYNLPPPSQGIASLQILSILNNFNLQELGEGTADYYHLIIEATKLAFADRDRWVSDPDLIDIPITQLLSTTHNFNLAQQVNMQITQGNSAISLESDTAWLGVVDQDGNAVSFIQSIADGFGSGIVAQGTGVLLQNRGKFFSLAPNHVNYLEPNKRTYHTLNPAMLLKQSKPYLVYGTMGGNGQPQTQAALVTRVVDFGFSAQDAVESPRWIQGRRLGAPSNELKIEGRVSQSVLEQLRQRGHQVSVQPNFTDVMGHAGLIIIDPQTKVRSGGADPRGDGLAVGY
ncbi:MAG: gamma-glutamyltransferase [Cyanobacteria bacterium P01_A01_bin.83]